MKNVLITGGSSGIGFAMSKIWAQNGYQLLWVSHSAEELERSRDLLTNEIGGIQIETLVQDLTEEDGPRNVFEWAEKIGFIDVVINNAGIGTYGYVHEINIEKELNMIQLNVIGLYKMTRLFLDGMLIQKKGTIINICSNSAFQPVPRMTTYAATKGFVFQFSRALEEELKILKSPLRIMTVCPAAIRDTPFRTLLSHDVQTFNGLATTTAEEVAGDVWKGFLKNKNFVISGRRMRWLYVIQGLIPGPIKRYLVRKETEKLIE